MEDVDYPDWADFIDSILQYHHPHGTTALELACGTGNITLEMEKRDDYEITATDASPEMIRIARQKGLQRNSGITWLIRDMCNIRLRQTFDIIYMVFDSLNYLQNSEAIFSLFKGIENHLARDGVFVFDFTTPNYSPKIAPLLNQKRNETRRYRYLRSSRFDPINRIHTNHFKVEKKDPETGEIVDRFEECHIQRIWTLFEIKEIVMHSNLCIAAAYEDFDLYEANNKSDRITLVLQHDS